MKKNTPTIGLIEGRGTGQELCDIFKNTLRSILTKVGHLSQFHFHSFYENYGYFPHSYVSMKNYCANEEKAETDLVLKKDTDNITDFFDNLMNKNTVGIFRSAINAESLYQLRMQEKIVKLTPLTLFNGSTKKNLLILRDQIQGYYANQSCSSNNSVINCNISFTPENYRHLLIFLKQKIETLNFPVDKLVFIYKYHLFGIELEKMVREAISDVGLDDIPVVLYQPDSGIKYLLNNIFNEKDNNIAIICGNEVGDFLLEILIHYYKLGTNETFFTTNYILGRNNLQMLQTMHGSADDLQHTNKINPTATLKACGYALENWFSLIGSEHKMVELTKNIPNAIKTTSDIVDYIVESW